MRNNVNLIYTKMKCETKYNQNRLINISLYYKAKQILLSNS